MRVFDRLFESRGRPFDPHTNARELVELRTINSKTFDVGNGKRRVFQTLSPLHFEIDGSLEDIDLTPRDDGDAFVIDRAPYVLRVSKTNPVIEYRGRTTGYDLTLRHEGISPMYDNQERLVWGAGPQKAVAIQIRPASVVTETWLHDPSADPEDRWLINGDVMGTKGADAENNPAEIHDQRFTGRVSVMADRKTRKRRWSNQPAWPVRLY